jgi:hypothetical protein
MVPAGFWLVIAYLTATPPQEFRMRATDWDVLTFTRVADTSDHGSTHRASLTSQHLRFSGFRAGLPSTVRTPLVKTTIFDISGWTVETHVQEGISFPRLISGDHSLDIKPPFQTDTAPELKNHKVYESSDLETMQITQRSPYGSSVGSLEIFAFKPGDFWWDLDPGCRLVVFRRFGYTEPDLLRKTAMTVSNDCPVTATFRTGIDYGSSESYLLLLQHFDITVESTDLNLDPDHSYAILVQERLNQGQFIYADWPDGSMSATASGVTSAYISTDAGKLSITRPEGRLMLNRESTTVDELSDIDVNMLRQGQDDGNRSLSIEWSGRDGIVIVNHLGEEEIQPVLTIRGATDSVTVNSEEIAQTRWGKLPAEGKGGILTVVAAILGGVAGSIATYALTRKSVV